MNVEKNAVTRQLALWVTSPDGVYGLIVVAGMIVVSRNLTGSSGEALLAVVATLVVFFVAHAYAATVSRLAHLGSGSLRDTIRGGVRESAGLLVVGVVPVLVLVLGVLGLLPHVDAVWLALAVDGILLGVLGWFITAARTPHFWARVGGTALTTGCGALMIVLKALIH